ncbi:MAG: hypothetical protein U0350_18455 [Caldilineaceae bacterium]
MNNEDDELQAHYAFDYSKAKPNRFAERLTQESVMVVLDPDVAAVFPTSEAVNEALRVLAAALQNLSIPKPSKRRKPRTMSAAVTQL